MVDEYDRTARIMSNTDEEVEILIGGSEWEISMDGSHGDLDDDEDDELIYLDDYKR